jgi:hypothetical protein
MMLAAAILIVSRRGTYGLHILRGTVGVGVLTLSLLLLVRSLHGDWNRYGVAGARPHPILLAERAASTLRPGDGAVRIGLQPEGSQPEVRHGRHDADAERVARRSSNTSAARTRRRCRRRRGWRCWPWS